MGRLLPLHSWWSTTEPVLNSQDTQQVEEWRWILKESEKLTTFHRILEIQHGKFFLRVHEPAKVKLYPTVCHIANPTVPAVYTGYTKTYFSV